MMILLLLLLLLSTITSLLLLLLLLLLLDPRLSEVGAPPTVPPKARTAGLLHGQWNITYYNMIYDMLLYDIT